LSRDGEAAPGKTGLLANNAPLDGEKLDETLPATAAADIRPKHAKRNFGGYSQERCVDGPRLNIGKYGIEQCTLEIVSTTHARDCGE
jgi:hypothetical protein